MVKRRTTKPSSTTEDTEKKGLFGNVVDALTSRDEKEDLEEAQKELTAAKVEARTAQSRATIAAAAAERKAREAEERAAAAEKEAAEAKAKLAQMQREEAAEAMRERIAKMKEQATAATVAAEAEKAQTYVVQSGDSLSKIAKALLGDASRWPEIFEANKDKIKNANLIYPGQELVIPKK